MPFSYHTAYNNRFNSSRLGCQLHVKNNSTEIALCSFPENVSKEITEYTQDKNLLLNTHYHAAEPLPFPNTKKVRLVGNNEHCLLTYLMFLSKVCTQYFNITERYINNSMENVDANKMNNLILDQQVSQLSFNAYLLGKTEEEFVIEDYNSYISGNSKRFPGWDYLDPNDLFFNTENTIGIWQDYFDMQNPMDSSILEMYHENNLKLIETTFNIKYTDMLEHGWQSSVLEFTEKYKTPIATKI